MPTVSVIVPNYNHARFLNQRIESVLRQDYQDFELIVADDCSTDNSREVLAQYASDSRVRVEFSAVNSGTPFVQWNKGARLARGRYLWFAESDDYADERLLERLVGVLEQNESVAYAYCRSWRVNADGRVDGLGDWYLDDVDSLLWKSDFCMDGKEFCRKYVARSPVVANASAALVRRSVYEAVGGADESLRLCGDWKFWAAAAMQGKVAFVSERLNYFRYHASTVRSKYVQGAVDVLEKLQVMRWIVGRSGVAGEELRNVRREASKLWAPAILSFRFPLSVKRQVLEIAKQIDPHPFRKIVPPALLTLRLKVARLWRGLRSFGGDQGELRRT